MPDPQAVDLSALAADLKGRLVSAGRDNISVPVAQLMNELRQDNLDEPAVAAINAALRTAGLQCRPPVTIKLKRGDRVQLTPVQPAPPSAPAAAGPSGAAAAATPQPLSTVQVSTTFEIPGTETVTFHGEVFGQMVSSRNALSNIGASAKSWVGGELKGLTTLLNDQRREALNRLRAEAQQLGANAVVGLRYDSSAIGDTANEIVAYGTAITVRPLPTQPESAEESR